MKQRLAVVVCVLFAAGCAHHAKGPKEANPAELERIQQRAAVDLNCPAQDITVEVLEQGSTWKPWTFAAKGCDKGATYLSRMGTIIRN